MHPSSWFLTDQLLVGQKIICPPISSKYSQPFRVCQVTKYCWLFRPPNRELENPWHFLTYIGYPLAPSFFFSIQHTPTYAHRHLKMGTGMHMGICKVVLDICSPSKHLKGISTGENGGEQEWRGMKEREEKKGGVFLNRIIEELFPPLSSFSTTLLPCVLCVICMNGIILALPPLSHNADSFTSCSNWDELYR